MNGKKGQSTFEMVILIAAVIVISTIIIGNYLSVSPETIALFTAKQSVAEKLSRQHAVYTIEKLEWKKCGTEFLLNIKTTPPTLDTAAFDGMQGNIDLVKNEILQTTSAFQSVQITVNSQSPICPE